MSLFRQFGILIVLAAGLGGVWLWNTRQVASDTEVRPIRGSEAAGIPVVVTPTMMATDSTVVEAVGTGRAEQSIMVYPSVPGEVAQILFEAGDRVDANQPLVRLDAEDEQAALDLTQVEGEQARQVLKRYEQAMPTGAVSELEFDSARTDLRLAELQVRRAEIALDNRTIEAPFAGVVGLPQVDMGDRVDESVPLATLDDRSRIHVEFDVPESFSSRVQRGDTVELRAWSLPQRLFEGVVSATASRLDPETRTLRVRATVQNDDDILLPGMSFAIVLAVTGDDYPSVPEVAVMWDRDGSYVWRIVEGRAERVTLSIVRRDGARVLVDGELGVGDQVVSEGVQRVRAGSEVRILDEATTGLSPAAAADNQPSPSS